MKLFSVLNLVLGLVLVMSQNAHAQSTPKSEPQIYANFITEELLRKHLTVLTADSLEGRETGTPGNDKAARYIASVFKKIGLEPIVGDSSYFQPIYMTSKRWNDIHLKFNEGDFKHLFDYIALPALNDDVTLDYSEIVYAGYGIDDPKYSDYSKQDVSGKVILIYEGEPHDKKGRSIITGTNSDSDWGIDNEKKLKLAKAKGVAYVLIVKPEIQKMFEKDRTSILGYEMIPTKAEKPNEFANHCYISPDILRNIAGKDYDSFISSRNKSIKKAKSLIRVFKGNFSISQHLVLKEVRSNNIMGFLKGSDPQLSDEVVILSAHMDHLGKRGEYIYHGADDDGSGTSCILTLANAFVKAKARGFGPKRSILFLTVTGEEKGLYGSDYYTTFPVLPLENTVTDLNIDMIGRIDDKHSKLDSNYIYIIGSDKISHDLHNVLLKTNAKYSNLSLDFTYNTDKDPNRFYYRSDHYNFAKKGIPIIFFFNGIHADYHKPTDTIEKIRFDILKLRSRLIFFTAWEIANRPERIQVD